MSTDQAISWESWPTDSDSGSLAWHKSRIPYRSDSNELQSVEVWLPKYGENKDKEAAPTGYPKREGTWLIYIHGGAWRDPMIDSSSFSDPVKQMLSSSPEVVKKVAGMASINYTLSAHPKHPIKPAPVPGPGIKTEPHRSGKHPDHIIDVLSALAFLDSKFAMGNNYVLIGHSCGAFLALQVAMDQSQWTNGSPQASHLASVPKPVAIVGLNGLYDLPYLLEKPGEKHQHLINDYDFFMRVAFGDNKQVWADVSPTSVTNWSKTWPEGKQVILMQSHSDNLLGLHQTELMLEKLSKDETGRIEFKEMDVTGAHNHVWEQGARLAEVLRHMLELLA